MVTRHFIRLLLTGLVLLLGATAAAAAPKWKLLGTSTARFQAERDEISVGAGEGVFDAIQLRVRGSNLTIFSAHVIYASGVPDKLEVRHEFKKDESTRVIPLAGRGASHPQHCPVLTLATEWQSSPRDDRRLG